MMKFYLLLLTLAVYGCNTLQTNITTQTVALLPTSDSNYAIGVAGAFAGVYNHRLMIGGGANFPDKKPWEGGTKVWYDNLYIFDLLQKKWIDTTYRLPQKMAYGYSFSLPEGVIIAGGDNDQNILSSVYKIGYDTLQKSIQIDTLPALPIPLSSMTGVAVGDELYIAGGFTTDNIFTKTFLKLDMQQLEKGWQSLSTWRGNSLAVGILIQQQNDLFLFAGRSKENGKPVPDASVYKYSLQENSWENITVKNPQTFMAGVAIPYSDSTILFVSGDNGETFNKIVNLQHQGLADSAATLQKNHSGFGNTVYLFNSRQATFEKYAELPFTGRVTAPIVTYNHEYILVSGEIRPGIRTPEIISYKF